MSVLPPGCGNGVIEGMEQCDGANLNGATCVSAGFAGGTLGCNMATCTFNTSMCMAAGCGNNILEYGEDCDGQPGCQPMCKLYACPMGQVAFMASGSGLPKAILDNATTTSTATVNTMGTITQLGVQLNLTHTFDGDVDMFLVPPASAQIELSTDNGSLDDNYTNTVFTPLATTNITAGTAPFTGLYLPEGNLTSANGTQAMGTWTLNVADDAGGDTGNLLGWRVFGCAMP
jgi:subtilisin-like proprotein convertase family protein